MYEHKNKDEFYWQLAIAMDKFYRNGRQFDATLQKMYEHKNKDEFCWQLAIAMENDAELLAATLHKISGDQLPPPSIVVPIVKRMVSYLKSESFLGDEYVEVRYVFLSYLFRPMLYSTNVCIMIYCKKR